jgi:hypothetical protein
MGGFVLYKNRDAFQHVAVSPSSSAGAPALTAAVAR